MMKRTFGASVLVALAVSSPLLAHHEETMASDAAHQLSHLLWVAVPLVLAVLLIAAFKIRQSVKLARDSRDERQG